MKYKAILKLAYLVILLSMCSISACGHQTGEMKNEYGVFIGVNPEEAAILLHYKTVVVDAAYYSKAEIAEIQRKGVEIYAYLNVGSIETFREAYPAYQYLIMGEYENWPGEYWVDVSQAGWQAHIAKEARSLVEKGVDGFFLDNVDVYYEYPRPEIFQGLVAIINKLEQHQKNILINGGDVFVTEAILEAETPMIQIAGVNQECVFTRIDFEKKELLEQKPDVSRYYKIYLEQCNDAGLAVYLTEYAKNGKGELLRSMEEYCKGHRFIYFVSPSVSLGFCPKDRGNWK